MPDEKKDAKAVTGAGALGGGPAADVIGTQAAVQHKAAERAAKAAQQEEMDRARAQGGIGGGAPLADEPKRHDIPSDADPSRAHEADAAQEREDSEAATKQLLKEKGPNQDMNAPDPEPKGPKGKK